MGVGQPNRFAGPKRHWLLSSLLNGDVVGVEIGPVGGIAYGIQPSVQTRKVPRALGKGRSAARFKWFEFKQQAP